MLANGQEFKGFIKELKKKPEIICIQETWLKPVLDFSTKGYDSVRRDREEDIGGGCIIFVKQGIQYKVLGRGQKLEFIVIEVLKKKGNVKIINFYNPFKRLSLEVLDEQIVHFEGKIICCGDFNAHSTLWDKCNDGNGIVIEEFMESKDLVCLNDGRGTRTNVRTGTEAAIDLTLVSNSLAGICVWEVFREKTIGSDNYPIAVEVNLSIEECYSGVDKWFFENADWEAFRSISEQEMEKIEVKGGVDKVNNDICNAILLAASQTIPKKGGKKKRRLYHGGQKNVIK